MAALKACVLLGEHHVAVGEDVDGEPLALRGELAAEGTSRSGGPGKVSADDADDLQRAAQRAERAMLWPMHHWVDPLVDRLLGGLILLGNN